MLYYPILLLIGVLSGMGVGSGGLLILYLTAIEGVPQLRAQGLNLFFYLFAAVGAMLIHLRRRRIDRRMLAVLCLFGAAGAICGVWLTGIVSVVWIRRIFGTLLILSGISVLLSVFRKKG